MFDPRMLNLFAAPAEITNWQDEQLSWKDGAYLHAGLSEWPVYRLTGPDVVAMFNDICVNNVERLKVGASTHLVMCSEKGTILGHGMLVREAEDTYRTHVHAIHVQYALSSGRYDVQCEDLTGQRFLFQIGGPRSLEILEATLGEDLHDIRFLRHRDFTLPGGAQVELAGSEMHVIRLGMAGTLGYELHGPMEHAEAVHNALMAAGADLGIRALGGLVYFNALHSETGFPNEYVHFVPAFRDDPGLLEFMTQSGQFWEPVLHGSLGDDISERYVTPYDLGWGHMVRFDHEFKGRAALEALAPAPPHAMVTLLWNPDDVVAVQRAMLEPGEAPTLMRWPADERFQGGAARVYHDTVSKDGRRVGVSSGRLYSWYYHEMLSLAVLDTELAEIGTEVTVLWGDPGTPQKEIRATVARYPYLDLERNEKIDVETIPRAAAASA